LHITTNNYKLFLTHLREQIKQICGNLSNINLQNLGRKENIEDSALDKSYIGLGRGQPAIGVDEKSRKLDAYGLSVKTCILELEKDFIRD